ncbi:sigma-54-dependent Fis family transcriptional regulator [Acinetobacter radioresistens]|uniref:sigma-54-dependent Fis family transcriptional regulator n=1 Tax=Acinetobacter TaxID=469 RepID=UPI0021CE383B|nr:MULTISPECIES: sigma-54-dependent Fis family transcriptional regulator [Acinetobacter]MCU4623868.1 sigma-54-dependent Fis family transcriptional regulator [Acinetobacter radioresistens]
MFSRPEKDTFVQSEWIHFVKSGHLKSDHLRKIINDSWIRSKHAGVSIDALDAPIVLQSHDLQEYIFENKKLIHSSLPILSQYQTLLDHHNLLLLISDAEGVILQTLGDTNIHHKAESLHLISGASWAEHACGTNAIGTALETGRAVQVHANEHYCTTAKRWTCTASVIRNPVSKKILGVLDVSGLRESYNQQTLALVTSLAAQIENQFYTEEIKTQNILLEKYLSFQQSSTHPSILFDQHGQAIQASAAMKELILKHSPFDELKIKKIFKTLHINNVAEFLLMNDLDAELHYETILHQYQTIGKVVYCIFKTYTQKNIAQVSKTNTDPNIIGQSQILMNALNKTRQLAKTPIPILLNGETGVGKELFAQFIHQHSAVHQRPFVVINCGSFSKELISSELFGYVEGAFTGARKGGMKGKIEEADGGTLFLDEIGELPLELQSHLLRALEYGEIYRLGENKPRKVNFRLISATNRNLKQEVEQKNFRLDLLHRIAVSQISIPSLKERKEDIPLLIQHYLNQCREKYQLVDIHINMAAMNILQNYQWPGNIRELRNAIEVMAVTVSKNIIDPLDIPEEIYNSQHSSLCFINNPEKTSKSLQDIEYDLIKKTLIDSNGNITKTAKTIGIAKSTLYLKIKNYHLENFTNEIRKNYSLLSYKS